jgi:polysaccharide pyruvyl transferase WcaK-like protein
LKIGILTFHDADNYGAVLQAYALTESIKNIKLDLQVEIINYKMPFILRPYKLIRFKTEDIYTFIRTLLSSVIYLKVRGIKKSKFNAFRKRYMSLSDNVYYKAKEINGYDAYIVGSDQVWNSDITGYEDIFFLSFCNNSAKKISYAASIGKNKLTKLDAEFIKQHIDNLEFISVREDNAVELIKAFTNKKICRVLDPTFLLGEYEWAKLVSDKKITQDFILLYMVSMNEEALKVADIISKMMKLPVWYINDSYKKDKYKFKHIRGIGPLEFLVLVKNAKFIVTTSFHGTAFSIIFNKKFVTVPYKRTSSRMVELLKRIKLENRIIEASSEFDSNYEFNIDYTIPNEILEQEKEKSLMFLKEALAIKNN